MPITATGNNSYGGTTVTQKYKPLEGLAYLKSDETLYSKLLTSRLNFLAAANILPQPLRLITDWDKALQRGAPDPPLVVISNNRSNWITEGVRMAKEQRKKTVYEGSNDLRALLGQVDKQEQSPPLYAPQRTEGNRRIFIVVHAYEYKKYREALDGTGLIVVGWSFIKPAGAPDDLTGFGASRYVAIEFCKYLRANKSGAPVKYAWLLDDNVVGITGFPGYQAVEDALAAAPTAVCAAVQGGAGVVGFSDTQKWAKGQIDAGRGRPTVLEAPSTERDIIQQAALWNIQYLTDYRLNFSPLFVASGEDVSFGNFFNLVTPGKAVIPYLYYGNLRVWKEQIKRPDESTGATLVRTARERYQRWFADKEAEPTPATDTAPPPVTIGEGATAKTLKRFIDDWWNLPKAEDRPSQVNTDDLNERHKAMCQAVEQISCGAIKAACVSTAALDRVFKIPDGVGQIIQRFPPPAR